MDGIQVKIEPVDQEPPAGIEIDEHSVKLEPVDEDQKGCFIIIGENTDADEYQVKTAPFEEVFIQEHQINLGPREVEQHDSFPGSSKDKTNKTSSQTAVKKGRISLNCDLCNIRFGYPEVLSWHIANCHGDQRIVEVVKPIDGNQKLYMCLLCKTVLKPMRRVIRHLYSQHSLTNLPFQCKMCSKPFMDLKSLKIHQITCTNTASPNLVAKKSHDSIKCKMCNEVCESESQMKIHVSNVHAKKEKTIFKCQYCDQIFQFQYHLFSHCNKVHPDEPILQCNICKEEFYKYNRYLWHRRYKHSGTRYTCNLCPASYSYRKSLVAHMQSIHSIEKVTYPLLIVNAIDNKQWPCNFCKAQFKCQKYLHMHMRGVHVGQILHCDHCTYTSRRRCDLICHLKRRHF